MIEKFTKILFCKECILHCHVYGWNNRILHNLSNGFAVEGTVVHFVANAKLSFSFSHIILKSMQVHFITIKISIVRFTVCIVHSQSWLFGQNFYSMSHESRLMKSWLSIEHYIISINQMTVNYLILMIYHKISCQRKSLLIT